MATKKWQRYSRYLGTGDWHCHTRYTDGRNTVMEMCTQAQKNGLELIAFTEHVRRSLSYDFSKLEADVKKARKKFSPTTKPFSIPSLGSRISRVVPG